jgi:hypothetical protein
MTRKCLNFVVLSVSILIPSYVRSQGIPVCGLNNNQNAYIPGSTVSTPGNNYNTFTPPPVGASYVDALTGCTVTRITDNATNGTYGVVYYASFTPFNANDQFLNLWNTNGSGWTILTSPAYSGSTPGSIVVPTSNMPGTANSGIMDWDWNNPNVFYYNTNTSLMKGTITGLPGCVATHNCTITTATLNIFTQYKTVVIPNEPDMSQDGNNIMLIGLNSNNTMDLGLYNLSTNLWTKYYTTVCTTSGGLSGQPGCVHKVQIDPTNSLIVVFNVNGSGTEQGEVLITSSGSVTQIDPDTEHIDSGYDINGNVAYVKTRIDSNTGGKDPTPAGQWSPSLTPSAAATVETTSAGGGSTLIYPTDPFNLGNTAVSFFNVNWASNHFSYRGGPTQPWVTVSFADGRNSGPEWFSNDSAHFTSPSTTFVGNTAPPANSWYPYEGEVVMAKINTNMNIAGLAPLSTIYRMAQARSRSQENFWVQVTASNSHDGNYIGFNSNMAYTNGCNSSVQSSNGCSDVYVISGANGQPLLGTTVLVPPASLTGDLKTQ